MRFDVVDIVPFSNQLEPFVKFLDVLHFDIVDIDAVLRLNRFDLGAGDAVGEDRVIRGFRRDDGVNRFEELHPGDTPFDAACEVATDIVELLEFGNGGVRFGDEFRGLVGDAFGGFLRAFKRGVLDDVVSRGRHKVLDAES